MRFKTIKRWIHRLSDRSGNEITVGKGSVCEIPSDADVRDTSVSIHGKSTLLLESGVRIRNVCFQIDSESTVRIAAGTTLTDTEVCVWRQSALSIGKDCSVNNVRFVLERGKVTVSDSNILSSGNQMDKSVIGTADGTLTVGDHNHLQNSFWIRFGGIVSIGRYNCINAGSQIRCDESVRIGSYNMISYNCDIWDTNTHCFYTLEEKKAMFEKDFPVIGNERNKPQTHPVVIGDGNWVGKNACILKGSTLGDETVVGTRAIVSNMTVGDGAKVMPAKSELK